MALKPTRASSGKKEKPARGRAMRHRPQGDPIDHSNEILAEPDPLGLSTAYSDDTSYFDLEYDADGKNLTPIVPDGTKP